MGEILQMWVAPEYRSQGVAIDIMDAVFAWAGENGYRAVVATIAKGNPRALRFYRKNGFTLAGGSSFDGPDTTVFTKDIEVEQAHTPADRPDTVT